MRAAQAVEILNRNTTFKPGWRIVAREHYWGENIMVGFVIDTVNTSLPDAEGRFEVRHNLFPERRLDVADLDEAGLDYAILQYAADLDMHENREFLQHRQPDGTWKARLHPHTDEGNRAFDRARHDDELRGLVLGRRIFT
jgi:hypothetical protein